MVCLREFILNKADVLRLKWSKNCARCVVLRNPEVHRTTLWEMDSVSGLITPFMTFYAPYHPRRRGSGLST